MGVFLVTTEKTYGDEGDHDDDDDRTTTRTSTSTSTKAVGHHAKRITA
jgi:hypothetical protein